MNKPKRCKFHMACGNMATHRAYHTFLKRDLDVCDACDETNEYLEPIAVEGDEVTILGPDGQPRADVWQGIVIDVKDNDCSLELITRVGREWVKREQVRTHGRYERPPTVAGYATINHRRSTYERSSNDRYDLPQM